MAGGSGKAADGLLTIVGWIILAILVVALAYIHEAAGECVRSAASPGDLRNILTLLDPPTTAHRVIVGASAAVVLYAVLVILNRIFHIFGRPWIEGLIVIAGAALAGWIPLDLCHSL